MSTPRPDGPPPAPACTDPEATGTAGTATGSVPAAGRATAVTLTLVDVARVRAGLRADCARCAGLCCVVPGFTASADFPISKPPGVACRHLDGEHRCGIHTELTGRGFAGCVAFDCLGAGQQTTQVTFAGRSWRTHPGDAPAMFAVFGVLRVLHESLHHLGAALSALDPSGSDTAALAARLRELFTATLALTTTTDADRLRAVDLDLHRRTVHLALTEASTVLRGPAAPSTGRAGPNDAGTRGAGGRGVRDGDLIGARLAGADLRGVVLTGRLLLGADLRGADLRHADLRGADLRGADLRGADLRGAWFLTPMQLAAARGDATTRLPTGLDHPTHWPTTAMADTTSTGSTPAPSATPRGRGRGRPAGDRRRGRRTPR